MIPVPHTKGKRYGVVGLGKSGRASAAALVASGADVLVWDDRIEDMPEGAIRHNFLEGPWQEVEGLVWSPGIPFLHPTPHPIAVRARREGNPLLCDIDLLAQVEDLATLVGITGTNGKSTTTALLAHLLQQAGRSAVAGGNIGAPALALPDLGRGGAYVLELSSYQLELCRQAHFPVGIWLNLTPDHLDRHGGMHGYAAAKSRLWRHTEPGDIAIIGADSAYGLAEMERAAAVGRNVVPVSGRSLLNGGFGVRDGRLIDARGVTESVIANLADCPALPGAHNAENAAAASAAALVLGLQPGEVAAGLATFPGLPHRQERVGQIGHVVYINDSKATNAESTAKALDCYRRIYWIAGGLPKAGGIAPLAPWFDRIVEAFLIGQAANTFGDTLSAARVAHSQSGDLLSALAAAHQAAQADPEASVVLLSPACASFDQWPNFEARGDAFRDLAVKLQRSLEGAV